MTQYLIPGVDERFLVTWDNLPGVDVRLKSVAWQSPVTGCQMRGCARIFAVDMMPELQAEVTSWALCG